MPMRQALSMKTRLWLLALVNLAVLLLLSLSCLSQLRDMGVARGGPPPFSKRDRSLFLQALDRAVQQATRGQAPG